MQHPDDRPTVDERYARAIESSHLEVTERRGDVDLLIAAGWCNESLGTSLYRLRTEFDAVRGEQRLALANAEEAGRRAFEVASAGRVLPRGGLGDAPAGSLAEDLSAAAEAGATVRAVVAESYRLTEEAERAALTARLLILMHLKTLSAARDALGRFAVGHATREKFMQDDAAVGRIAGRALESWLDPNCPHCEGRGFNGGFGTPMALCAMPPNGCGGTTKRQVRLASDDAGHAFGRSLLVQMDRKTDHVTGLMRRYLSLNQRQRDVELDAGDAIRQQQKRLADLRSTQAEAD